MNTKRNLTFLVQIFAVLTLFITLNSGQAADRATWPRKFDSAVVAAAETSMWRAYYERNYNDLWVAMTTLLTEQFNLSELQAIVVGGSAARAARRFAMISTNAERYRYQTEVLPSLIFFYRYLKSIVGGLWDPQEAARAELDWWVARRTPGKNRPQYVGQQIAKLYALIYGEDNPHIQNAGYLRAKAAYLRDKQSRRGKIHWEQIEGLLAASYAELIAGIS